MKTVALLSRKGGAGKTTCAIHMGVLAQSAGLKVLFLDLDPQGSLSAWWHSREAETPGLIQSDARQLPDLIEAAAKEKYDLAVVDTPPAVTFDTARTAALVDLALIPLRPSVLDIYAVSSTADVVKANGGQVLGAVRHPLSASDFSSFLLQAQASKAQILGLANAGGDTINSIKAAKEFGITKTMKLAALLVFIDDIHSLGLETTQGLVLTDSWYWNKDATTRKWAERYFDKMKKMPSSLQAADYSATITYLNAVKAVGSTDSDKVMAQLKKTKIDDFYAKGYIRQDGSMIHDMYLMQVKTPAESREPWDYYKITATIPGEQAFTTKAETRCALWK